MNGSKSNFVTPPTKVGLIAGWGRFPIVVAEALRRHGCQTFCAGIKDHADPALQNICDDFIWTGLAKIGRTIRYFRRHQVCHATLAGKVFKVRLFQKWAWLRHMPDWRTVQIFWPHFIAAKKDRRDDTLLSAIVNAYAEDGITIAPATDFAPELLVKFGQLTRRGPSTTQQKDIEFGWNLAKTMGGLDVGQSVVVKNRTCLAIEAIEGTDECIRRAGQLCPAGGFTVVKVAKPQQDMRFDMPTIGMGTLEMIVAAGGKMLVVEAGKTIFIDEPLCVEFANRHGLILVSLDSPASAEQLLTDAAA